MTTPGRHMQVTTAHPQAATASDIDVDIAIVGSGHNSLVAAGYLAAHGLRVHIIEADTVAGGAVSTVERFPGYAVDRGSSAHLMIRHTPIVDELDLAAHGLHYVDCDPWAFAPVPEGSCGQPIIFFRDLDRTCASIAQACGPADAAAYRRFVADWTPRSRAVLDAFSARPTGAHLLRAFSGQTLASRAYLATGFALCDHYFVNERLKAALAWFGSQSGPDMQQIGTAPMIGFAALLHQIPPGRPIGGSGGLTTALLSKIGHHGGTLTLGDAATSVDHAGDRWRVRTGRAHITASAVLLGCHILSSLDLLATHIGPSRLRRWRSGIDLGPGVGMVVRAGTDRLPQYRGIAPEHTVGLGLAVTDRDHLIAARTAGRRGLVPQRPVTLPMAFSPLDRSIAPAGRELVSVWAQWHPSSLGQEPEHRSVTRPWNEEDSGRAAQAIITELERFSPDFGRTITDIYVQSPSDLESELGLRGANVMHVEMSLGSMFAMRPRPELARGTVPGLSGIFLTGASTHPGGGVHGASGRAAASDILRYLHKKTGFR